MVLSLDIGTSFMKAALFDKDTQEVLSYHSHSLLASLSDPSKQSWEFPPSLWIEGLNAILDAFSHNLNKRDVSALVIGANGPSLVLCDAQGKPLMNALLWMDQRDMKYAKQIHSEHPNGFLLSRMLYFQQEHKELYEKVHFFFSIEGYIQYLLTGESHTVLPASDFMPLYWDEKIMQQFNLTSDKVPQICYTGDYVGNTKKSILFPRLPIGSKVFAGGPDYALALLGVGAVKPGRLCNRTGSSEAVNLCTEETWTQTQLMSYQHVIKGYYNIAGMLNNSGTAIDWFKKISVYEGSHYQDFVTELCQRSPPGAKRLLFLPYLSGERYPIWDANAKGAFIGLKTDHGQNDMGRAVLEATLYSVKGILNEMEAHQELGALRVTGNLSTIPGLNQLRANICNKEVWISDLNHSELRGGLAIALAGKKYYHSLQEAAEACSSFKQIYFPQKESQNMYEDMFAIFQEGYGTMKSLFHKL